MEIGKEVYVKRERMYREKEHKYEKGVICGIYSNHISVEFKKENGNSYKESFFEDEIIKEEEIKEGAYIY